MMNLKLALAAVAVSAAHMSIAQVGKPTGKPSKAKETEAPTINNYVINGDFENFDFKPLKNPGQLPELCPGWMAATQANPDLFAKDVKSPRVSIPINECGVQEPYNGRAYAGIVAYTKDPKKSRTYLQAKLKKMLTKDEVYCVHMRVSLADQSKYATNNVGIFFSDRKVTQTNTGPLNFEPQIRVNNGKTMTNMDGWEYVCTTYLAKGMEEYIIIGGFGADDKITADKPKRPAGLTGIQINDAYYYIDDIEIFPIEAISECGCSAKPQDVDGGLIYGGSGSTEGLKPAEAIAATGVYFGYLNDEINTMFDDALANLVGILRANPSYKLEITGHCDTEEMNEAKVNARYNGLAQRRAEAVKNYLTGKGIAENRLTVVSKDNTEPASTRSTPLSKAQNRRVMFVLR